MWVIKAGLTFQVHFSTYQCTSNSLNSVCCPPPLWLVLVLLNHPETESGLIPSFAQQLRQTPLASTARAFLSSELSPSPHLLPVVIVPVCFTGGRLWGLYNSHPSTAPELATGQPGGKQHGRPRGRGWGQGLDVRSGFDLDSRKEEAEHSSQKSVRNKKSSGGPWKKKKECEREKHNGKKAHRSGSHFGRYQNHLGNLLKLQRPSPILLQSACASVFFITSLGDSNTL